MKKWERPHAKGVPVTKLPERAAVGQILSRGGAAAGPVFSEFPGVAALICRNSQLPACCLGLATGDSGGLRPTTIGGGLPAMRAEHAAYFLGREAITGEVLEAHRRRSGKVQQLVGIVFAGTLQGSRHPEGAGRETPTLPLSRMSREMR